MQRDTYHKGTAEDRKEFGSRIRKLLEAKRWKQGQLAERVGLSRQMVNSLINGHTLPEMRTAHEIARALGTTLEELGQGLFDLEQ